MNRNKFVPILVASKILAIVPLSFIPSDFASSSGPPLCSTCDTWVRTASAA